MLNKLADTARDSSDRTRRRRDRARHRIIESASERDEERRMRKFSDISMLCMRIITCSHRTSYGITLLLVVIRQHVYTIK